MNDVVEQGVARDEASPPAGKPAVPKAKSRALIIGGIVIVAALGFAVFRFAHVGPHAAGGTGGASAAQPVEAATIGTGDIRVILDELGTVNPLANITVQTQVNGQLIAEDFKEGQIVKKGDLLAEIDPRPFQAALEQAQGTLAHDQALLAEAETDLKRFETLEHQDSIARQQAEDQRYLVQQDQGTVLADQGMVDTAKVNLAYCRITAPVTGRVGLRLIDPGNVVQTTNTTGLVILTQLQPISVILTVAEDDIPALMKRLNAAATLQVEAYDRANKTLLATGAVSSVDNQINTTTGTVNVRAHFPNDDFALFPNQFVNARVILDTLHGVVRVPTAAVLHGAPGTYVYVVKPDNTVVAQPVTLGPTDGGYAQVLSGLSAGDRVVTDGTDRLRDGQRVTLAAPQGH